ncbi:hypothetical protein COCOBI_14-2550 [Coccomyxa sp. Obi]|nr:hypothetical protein COCOBI_14-2550 [Coccomyxa sp. Obi]
MASSTHSTLVEIANGRNTEHHWRFLKYAELPPAMRLKEPALPCCPTHAARDSVESQVLETMRKTILELRTRARCDKSITHDERIGLLNEALAIKPDSPELLVHRAYCHHLAGDPEAMELDICTAIALASDMAVSFYGTPAVEGRFFRAIARGTMGYIQGALSDLRICLMVLQGNRVAMQDVQQELSFWESFLDGPHDAGRDSPVAEACHAREALGVFLAQEALAKAAEVCRLRLTEAYASLSQRKTPGEQAALSVKKTDAADSPRSATAGPGSSTSSSPPESPRSADLAPAQHICASVSSTCDQTAPVQQHLQPVVLAHQSIPPHTEERAQRSQPRRGPAVEGAPPFSHLTPHHVMNVLTRTEMAPTLLAIPLWACSRSTPQWVQNNVIQAGSSVINVAAAMAAVGDYLKKAVCP